MTWALCLAPRSGGLPCRGRGLNPSGEKAQRCVRSEYLAQGLSQDSVGNLRCVRITHAGPRYVLCSTVRASAAVQCSVRVYCVQTQMLVPGRAARSSTRKVCVSIHTQPFLFAPPAQNQGLSCCHRSVDDIHRFHHGCSAFTASALPFRLQRLITAEDGHCPVLDH